MPVPKPSKDQITRMLFQQREERIKALQHEIDLNLSQAISQKPASEEFVVYIDPYLHGLGRVPDRGDVDAALLSYEGWTISVINVQLNAQSNSRPGWKITFR